MWLPAPISPIWQTNSGRLSPAAAQALTTSSSAPSSTPLPIRPRKTGGRGRSALIDTSVAVRLSKTELLRLRPGLATSTLSIAELARGLHSSIGKFEQERRRRQLLRIEGSIETVPFDLRCALAHGFVSAAVERIGRKAGGSRAVDLLIASTALA